VPVARLRRQAGRARKGLTPAQIRTAVRFARLAAPAGAGRPRPPARLIERQLRNADKALGGAQAATRRAPVVTTTTCRMLNVEAASSAAHRAGAAARGHGTLCFLRRARHRQDGAGRAHRTQALDRPLMVKQASDLMSKYVGETEQNMAAMFREAEAEKAVLLLDEADSFLQDRRGAQRTYEVTEVNEMLQGMERFAASSSAPPTCWTAGPGGAAALHVQDPFKPLTRAQRERCS
jgi:hypothetical protein